MQLVSVVSCTKYSVRKLENVPGRQWRKGEIITPPFSIQETWFFSPNPTKIQALPTLLAYNICVSLYQYNREMKQLLTCRIIIFVGLILTFSLLNSSSENSTTTQNASDVLLDLMREVTWPIEDQPSPTNQTLQIDWEKCFKAGEKHLKQKEDRERLSLPLAVDSPSYRHQKVMGTTERARNLSRTGYQLEGASYFMFG